MGKKMKPKGRNPRKPQPRTRVSDPDKPDPQIERETKEEKETKEGCNHYSKGDSHLNKILLSFLSSTDLSSCDHCRDESPHVNSKKGGAKKKKDQKEAKKDPLWVCLDCGRSFCGGAVSETVPYGHSRRHAKQDKHNWAVGTESTGKAWCFVCNCDVPIDMPAVEETATSNPRKSTSDPDYKLTKSDSKFESNSNLNFQISDHRIIRGLSNLGNTCFFNSVLQNLLALKTLRASLFPNPNSSNPNSPTRVSVTGPLTMSLKKLFIETSLSVEQELKGTLSPKNLFSNICAKAPQFRGFQQQDSHELLRYLLDGLHAEEISARKLKLEENENDENFNNNLKMPSLVDSLFGGLLSSTVSCKECGHTSVVHEPFLDLSLPVPAKKSNNNNNINNVNSRKSGVNRPSVLRGRGRSQRMTRYKHVMIPRPSPVEDKMEASSPREDQSMDVKPVSEGPVESSTGLKAETEGPAESSTVFKAEGEGVDSLSADFKAVSVFRYGSWMDYLAGSEGPVESSTGFEVGSEGPEESSTVFKAEGEGVDSVSEDFKAVGVFKYGSWMDYLDSEMVPDGMVSDATHDVRSDDASGAKSEGPDYRSALLKAPEPDHTVLGAGPCERKQSEEPDGCTLLKAPEPDSTVLKAPEPDSTVLKAPKPDSMVLKAPEPDSTVFRASEPDAAVLDAQIEDYSDASLCVGVDESDSTVLDAGRKEAETVVFEEESWLMDDNGSGTNPSCYNTHQEEKESDSAEDVASDMGFSTLTGPDPIPNPNPISLEREEVVMGPEPNPKPIILEREEVVMGPEPNPSPISLEREEVVMGPHPNPTSLEREEEADFIGFGDMFDEPEEVTSGPVNRPVNKPEEDDDSIFWGSSISSLNGFGFAQEEVDTDTDNPVSVASCLALFTKPELLSGEHKWHCENCSKLQGGAISEDSSELRGGAIEKVMRDAVKRFLIDKAPIILTVHLKRFSQDVRGRLSKLRGHVGFEELLDLNPYFDKRSEQKERFMYKLIGLVEHSGSMSGGHYISYVRGERIMKGGDHCQTWFYCSDSHVKEVSLQEVLRSEAYLLFYERIES